MSGFRLVRPPVLAGATVLRDDRLRLDVARQAESWGGARVVVVDRHGRSPVDWTSSPRLRTLAAAGVAGSPPAEALLLGEADGVPYWAMRGGLAQVAADDATRWTNLLAVGAELPAVEAALLAAAVALLNWHDNAGFCARDGSPTRPSNAGWARVCEAERHEEYPRTDPAVICLVHDGADRLLLARQRTWPARRFSVLAGFVEAGESLEACVAREVAEEVGVDVCGISYLGSQSWPFPRSIMVGFQAVADPDQPLRLDDNEIVEALWVHRDELGQALTHSGWGAEADGGQLRLPGAMSIARTMIDSWVAAASRRG